MNTSKGYIRTLFIFNVFLLTVTSCGPVHRFTRVKKIPREYSLNYCGSNIKAPRTDLNKEPWIIFSDRTENQTFNNAGGKVKAKDIDYLDAFLVIGKKGEYLKLIKYTPDILKNGKLDYKKAEYFGWVHQSNMLLNQQSVTDIASGRKNKMLTIFTDTLPINEPDKYLAKDSLKTYKDLDFANQNGTISPYSLVYRLKQSEDGAMSLISKKPYIKAEEVKDDVLGWVANTLLQDIGTGLHINISDIPENLKTFSVHGKQNNPLDEEYLDAGRLLSEQYKTIKYSPISSYSTKDTLVAFRTRIALPLLDYSDNYIFNVDGGQISHKRFRHISKNLRHINVSFVFEGKEQTISQFPQIINALQNLQPVFEQPDEFFTFQFNSVMTFDETGKLLRPLSSELTSDYSSLINHLSDKANQKDKLRPIKASRASWWGLRKAVESFDKHRDATNLIVLIGEKGISREGIDSTLVNRLRQNNCRIIGFQLYAGEGDQYNNFVLDIESMINSYADGMLRSKREILVSPEQIKRANHYTRVGDIQNGYRLDFPDNSITQGALFFPQKSSALPMEILSNNIDTIVQQIKQDNSALTRYMSKSFRSVGNNRTKYDNLFLQNYGMDTTRIPQKKFISSFSNETPGWYVPSEIIVLNDSTDKTMDYRLMLSDKEMKELKEFVSELSKYEVDYIDIAKEKKKAGKRKPCNCPEDDLFIELENGRRNASASDSLAYVEKITIKSGYADTKKIRLHLIKTHLVPIKYCKLCKEKGGKLKTMTLADAQYRITGCPVSDELLNTIQIKDLKDKSKVSDRMLEKLVNYYKKMKKELDKAEQFESNGETYYWVERKLLP